MRWLAIPLTCIALAGCAPAGYHYEAGSFTPTKDVTPDPIQSQAIAAQADAARRRQDWRSFPGDISTWSGIPPFPPRASTEKTAANTSHCSMADVTGHRASAWMTSTDCAAWIRDAQALAKAGPTAAQVYSYRIDKCAEAVSHNAVQTYSGEFQTICARAIPLP